MKLACVALIFLTGFSTLSALSDKCEENNLNALMVHFRKLHTDFKVFKESYETQKNASLKELKALQNTTDQLKSDNQQKTEEIQNMTNQLKEETVKLKSDNQQKTEEIQKLNEKLQNMTERLTELTVEKQTTPLVSFVVKLHVAEEINCIEKLPFGSVLLNEGNGFDNTSKSFKAPYSGFYSLTVQLCKNDYQDAGFSVYSRTYNKSYGATYSHYSYDCSSFTTVAELKSDEEVYVQVKCSGTMGHTGDYYWTMFSGILIHLSP